MPELESGANALTADGFVPSLDVGSSRRVLRSTWLACSAALLGLIALVSFSHVDIVVEARGIVAPRGETARAQARRAGKVAEIRVRNGQPVQKGTLLIRMDHREVETTIEKTKAQIGALENRVQIARSLQISRKAALEAESDIQRLELASSAARLRVAEARRQARTRQLDAAAKERVRSNALVANGLETVASGELSALKADIAGSDLDVSGQEVKELQIGVQRGSALVGRSKQDVQLALLNDDASIAQMEADRAELEGRLAELRLEKETLDVVAPRDGVVEGLAVHDTGDIVEAGATLAFVVPKDEELQVIADVPAQEAADVVEGQRVRVKIDAFPFQDYGRAEGEVLTFARDTTRTGSGRREESFEARVRLTSLPNAKGDRAPVPLRPGMTVSAELVVRRDRLALALIRPLRGLVDSLRR
jgi:multidrug resistance efflux pump